MENKSSNLIALEKPAAGWDADERRQQELAQAAIGRIKEAERTSGFGRFVLKVQNLFRHPKSSRRGGGAQWRATPTVLALGILLLAGFFALFLVAEPEGETARRFRPSDSLVGPEDREPLSVASFTPPPVTESQLVGEVEAIHYQPGKKVASRRSGSSPPSDYDQPGKGLESAATVFLAPAAFETTSKTRRQQKASLASEVQLPTGTEILAHTTNAISSGLESPVMAVVDQDVKLNGSVLIPQGTRAIGFTGGAVKDRVNVSFTSLVLPDGREVEFSGMALMKDGSAGLVGKTKGKGNAVLAGAGRIATGAAVLATQFAGRPPGSLQRPFSQADLLRNQLAGEIASQGTQLSNRLARPLRVPIVSVPTNRRIRIFLLAPIRLENGELGMLRASAAPWGRLLESAEEQNGGSLESLLVTQAAYIEALEGQLSELRTALVKQTTNGQR